LGEPFENNAESLIDVINQYEDYLHKHGGDVFRLYYNQVWAPHIPDARAYYNTYEMEKLSQKTDARVHLKK
jgi:hypothetical protein